MEPKKERHWKVQVPVLQAVDYSLARCLCMCQILWAQENHYVQGFGLEDPISTMYSDAYG